MVKPVGRGGTKKKIAILAVIICTGVIFYFSKNAHLDNTQV